MKKGDVLTGVSIYIQFRVILYKVLANFQCAAFLLPVLVEYFVLLRFDDLHSVLYHCALDIMIKSNELCSKFDSEYRRSKISEFISP